MPEKSLAPIRFAVKEQHITPLLNKPWWERRQTERGGQTVKGVVERQGGRKGEVGSDGGWEQERARAMLGWRG